MSRWLRGVLLLAAALVTAAAWPAAVGATDETVVIGQGLRPAELAIEPGTTVTWQNRDRERHRIRSKDGPVRFDSKNLEPGESFSFTFTVAGTYPYYDHRERDETAYFGTIVVGDVEAGAEGAIAEPADAAEVSVIDDAFTPAETSVIAGGTVEWVNRGADEHTVTANDLSFDSGELVSGASFAMTFETAGEYAYFCTIHTEMRGTISVVDGPAGDGIEPTSDEPPSDQPATGDEAAAEAPVAEEAADFGAPSLGSALDALATPPPE